MAASPPLADVLVSKVLLETADPRVFDVPDNCLHESAEGKTITVEERETIRCADDFKFALLIARLLARVFKSADLAMLKEKPKEVLIKEA